MVATDLPNPRKMTRQIQNFRGLLTNLAAYRNTPTGFLSVAQDVQYDDDGNVRPRDGYEQWWAPLPQRLQLADMQLGETTWTKTGTGVMTDDSTTSFNGFQSKKLVVTAGNNATITRTYAAAPDPSASLKRNTNGLVSGIWEATKIVNIANARVDLVIVTSVATYTFAHIEANNVENVWKSTRVGNITFALGETITSVAFIVTATGATVTLNCGDVYAAVQMAATGNYAQDSFCTGAYEFRKVASPTRYLVAVFGETLYADLNEAKAPYKVLSGLTRNLPTYFEANENRCLICNGSDSNLIFTGTMYRNAGYPVPPAGTILTPTAGAGLTAAPYYYGVTFVYGEGATVHGESSMYQIPGVVTAAGGNLQVTLTAIPVGALGSGVIKRRIYRNIGNGGPNASKYLVKELADNITTTWIDALDDITLVVQQVGPTDNGIPPVAKYVKYFDQGMVYAIGSQVYYQRPGIDLNSTMETIPAANTFLLPPAGDITALFVFGYNLYIFQEQSISACQWVGGNLVARPVLRAKEALIGAADQNAVTAFGNKFILFKDRLGQFHKMLPNEEILPVSTNIANLLNDVNPYPTAGSLFFDMNQTAFQWNAGTVGANLSVGTDGKLSYNYGNIAGVSYPNSASTFGPPVVVKNQNAASWGASTIGFGTASVLNIQPGVERTVILKNGGIGLQTAAFTFYWTAPNPVNIYDVTVQITMYKSAKGVRGAQLGQGQFVYHVTPLSFGTFVYPPGFNIPGGEDLEISIIPITSDVDLFMAPPSFSQYFSIDPVNSTAKINNATQFPAMSITAAPALLTTLTSAILDGSVNIQRWANAAVTAPLLRGGQSIQVYLETYSANVFPASDPTGTLLSKTLLYSLTALADNFPATEPLTQETDALYTVRDYRINDNQATPGWTDVFPLPAPNPQRRYARITIILDPNRVSSPVTPANSRVSNLPSDAFPSTGMIQITGSTEANFIDPYAATDYTRDIFTSEIKQATLVALFGKFVCNYSEDQQKLTFQIRTGTTAATILNNAWVTITPNIQIPASAINNPAADTVFQWRIIFQDNPAKQGTVLLPPVGTPSTVSSVSVAWSITSTSLAPLMPPTLIHFKGKAIGSWASDTSRTLDRTVYMDTYVDPATGSDAERFATWTGFNFGAFTVVNNKLIGGPIAGGQLVRLFNSAIGDIPTVWPGLYTSVPAIVVTCPFSAGTRNIKTLMGVLYGFELGYHKDGMLQNAMNQWPVVNDGGANSLVPFFTWGFSTHQTGSILSNTFASPILTDTAARQPYNSTLTWAARNPSNAADSYKPYEPDYWFDVAGQERAFVFAAFFSAYKDSSGNAVFPALTSIEPELFIENMRGN